MKTQVLSSVQAMQPGAEIWIIPAPADSPWSARIDWYLNFQISRGLKNKSAQRNSKLENLLGEIKWALPREMTTRQSPLLIATMGRLPTDWVLIPENWSNADQIFSPTQGLKCTQLRLFTTGSFQNSILKNTGLAPAATLELVNPAER